MFFTYCIENTQRFITQNRKQNKCINTFANHLLLQAKTIPEAHLPSEHLNDCVFPYKLPGQNASQKGVILHDPQPPSSPTVSSPPPRSPDPFSPYLFSSQLSILFSAGVGEAQHSRPLTGSACPRVELPVFGLGLQSAPSGFTSEKQPTNNNKKKKGRGRGSQEKLGNLRQQEEEVLLVPNLTEFSRAPCACTRMWQRD